MTRSAPGVKEAVAFLRCRLARFRLVWLVMLVELGAIGTASAQDPHGGLEEVAAPDGAWSVRVPRDWTPVESADLREGVEGMTSLNEPLKTVLTDQFTRETTRLWVLEAITEEYAEVFCVSLFDEHIPADVEHLKRYETLMGRSADALTKAGVPTKCLDVSLRSLSGRAAYRVLSESTFPTGLVSRTLGYRVPTVRGEIRFEFSTTADRFGQREPLFESVAESVRVSLEAPTDHGRLVRWLIVLLLFVMGIVMAAVTIQARTEVVARSAAGHPNIRERGAIRKMALGTFAFALGCTGAFFLVSAWEELGITDPPTGKSVGQVMVFVGCLLGVGAWNHVQGYRGFRAMCRGVELSAPPTDVPEKRESSPEPVQKQSSPRRLTTQLLDVPPTPPASDASPTKVCPYCAEEIRAAAIKCRYCGSML